MSVDIEYKTPYHWEWYEAREGFRVHVDTIVDFFRHKTGTLLAVGCGDGLILSKLVSYTKLEVSGVDISEAAIGFCQQKVKGADRFFIADAFDSFHQVVDHVLCSEVIEHVARPLDEMLSKLSSMCRDSLLLTTPDGSVVNNNPHHVREYKEEEVASILKNLFVNVASKKIGASIFYYCEGKKQEN